MAVKLLNTALKAAIKTAMKRTSQRFADRCTEEIQSKEWPYPTTPKIRDIVDTGRLRDSQVVTETATGFQVRWTAPYADSVHEGGTTLKGERFPGRPWTRDAVAELPTMFGQELGRALKQQEQTGGLAR